MTDYGVTGLGKQHVTPDQLEARDAAFQKRLDRARQHDEHVWMAIQAHGISDRLAGQIASGEDHGPITMDTETLINLGFGCYRCEESLTKRSFHRRCPGDAEEGR